MKLLKGYYGIFAMVLCSLFFVSTAHAVDYVLPYPSYMPGNKLYKIHLAWEKIQEYWHFGNISRFKYHLQASDKYLVEAKILFEYKQYKLAVEALERSDKNFQKSKKYLEQAKNEGKNISQKKQILYNAKTKHKEVLNKLLDEVPKKIEWKEENKKPINLDLYKRLMTSSANVRQ